MRTAFRLSLMTALLLASQPQAFAAASILIWPIDPAIEANQPATALWLEMIDWRRACTCSTSVLTARCRLRVFSTT